MAVPMFNAQQLGTAADWSNPVQSWQRLKAAHGGGLSAEQNAYVDQQIGAGAKAANPFAGGANPFTANTATAGAVVDPYATPPRANAFSQTSPNVQATTPATPPIIADGTTLQAVPSAAPAFDAPNRAAPGVPMPELGVVDPYTGPTEFSFDATDIYKDPSYKVRQKEGLNAVEMANSARGIAGGDTLKALVRYGQEQASKEFTPAFNRAKDTFTLNSGAAGDAYDRSRLERDAQYGAKTGNWTRDAGERNDDFDARFRTADAEYKPTYDTWSARELARRDDATRMFDRSWDRERYQGDDSFRRWEAGLDDSFRNRQLSADDKYRYTDLDFRRKNALASYGQF